MSQIDSIWTGEIVAVLGNSPALSEHLKRLPAGCKTIAASRAVNVYPHADMAVSIDGTTPADFEGLNVAGVPVEPPAIYVGMHYERAELAPGHVIEFRNTGLLAIRVAAMAGASRIVLAGFDTDAYEARYDGAYPGITQAFRALVADLRARGIDVVDLAETGNGFRFSESAPETPVEAVKVALGPLVSDETASVLAENADANSDAQIERLHSIDLDLGE